MFMLIINQSKKSLMEFNKLSYNLSNEFKKESNMKQFRKKFLNLNNTWIKLI